MPLRAPNQLTEDDPRGYPVKWFVIMRCFVRVTEHAPYAQPREGYSALTRPVLSLTGTVYQSL